MVWLGRQQAGTLVGGVTFGVVWMLAQALVPWALGRAVDAGIEAGSARALAGWSAVLLALAAAQAVAGVVRHRLAVSNWVQASLTASQLVGHHVTRVGAAMPTRLPTGEVVSTVASDAVRLGSAYDITARFAGSIASYALVAVLLLRASTPLGLVVLLGVPAVGLVLGLLVRPLARRQQTQRDVAGRLTTLGADTVAGLRVLRGIGGERDFLRRYTDRSQEVRRAGVAVAGVQSWLDALQVLLPGTFVVLVTWLGARAAITGEISAGDLVSFYGYAAFLVVPLRTATEMVQKTVRAHVGAQRILAVLAVPPAVADPARPAPEPPAGSELHDPVSGLTVRPGMVTALVSAEPAAAAEVADRLGRFGDDTPVTWGGVPLTALPVATVRRRIVVADADPRLFTGTLRSELDPAGRHDDAAVMAAVHAAAATDVLDSLPGGLDGEVTERGRSLSGGQRQRVALTRALLTDAETLVLVEPTSAVDAHTEAEVADRLTDLRDGRTTVLVTASPLLLDRADDVVLLENGQVTAAGTHRELLHRDDAAGARYRRTVLRGADTGADTSADAGSAEPSGATR
jgi:ABC-type multidrug transport system fused ATPase/permease subunit